MHPPRRVLLGFCLLALVLPALHSQAPPPSSANSGAVIKTKVSVVLVDVVVTKGKGDPVPDLHQEDFKITEDGKLQTISFFDEHKGNPPSSVAPESLPPHVFSNGSSIKTADSVNVLLLDWLNTQPQDRPYVLSQIVKYIKGMPDGMRLAIFTLNSRLHIVQGFTSDPAALLAAVDDKKPGTDAQKSSLLPTATQTAADESIIQMM